MAYEVTPVIGGGQFSSAVPSVHRADAGPDIWVPNNADLEADLDKAAGIRADEIEGAVNHVITNTVGREFNVAGYTSDDVRIYPFGLIEHSAILLYFEHQRLLERYYQTPARPVFAATEERPESEDWRLWFDGDRREVYYVKYLLGRNGGWEYKLTVKRRA